MKVFLKSTKHSIKYFGASFGDGNGVEKGNLIWILDSYLMYRLL